MSHSPVNRLGGVSQKLEALPGDGSPSLLVPPGDVSLRQQVVLLGDARLVALHGGVRPRQLEDLHGGVSQLVALLGNR